MVQYFIKDNIAPAFPSETCPELHYMGNITPEISSYPRVMHSHSNHVEISIIYSGQSEYWIHNTRQLIRPGDILIYNSNTVHDELSGEGMQIGSYFFAAGNIQIPGLRPNALIPDDVNPVFHVTEDFDRILRLCQDMLHTQDAPGRWSPYIAHFSMCALLEIIWRIVSDQPSSFPPPEPHYMGRIIKDYIDQHYREPLTLGRLCDELHLSASYISHECKELLGYSPMQYILRRKIGEAQTLLISTNYSITQIAQMVGYDSQSHFDQRFSKYVGISPSQFRRNYQKYDVLKQTDHSD